MKKTRNGLLALYVISLLAAAALYVAGDIMQADMAFLADASRQTRFISSTALILLTIGLLPLALRLFKFRRVHADLMARQAAALRKWGTLRLLILGGLLVVNTLLYYAFAFESAYGYLAVVVLLCMPFVAPTMSRCQAEVTEVKEDERPEEETSEEA